MEKSEHVKIFRLRQVFRSFGLVRTSVTPIPRCGEFHSERQARPLTPTQQFRHAFERMPLKL
jgi:hypothetical protein